MSVEMQPNPMLHARAASSFMEWQQQQEQQQAASTSAADSQTPLAAVSSANANGANTTFATATGNGNHVVNPMVQRGPTADALGSILSGPPSVGQRLATQFLDNPKLMRRSRGERLSSPNVLSKGHKQYEEFARKHGVQLRLQNPMQLSHPVNPVAEHETEESEENIAELPSDPDVRSSLEFYVRGVDRQRRKTDQSLAHDPTQAPDLDPSNIQLMTLLASGTVASTYKAKLLTDIPSAGKYAGALVCAKVLHPHVEVKVAKEEIKALQQARMLGTHKNVCELYAFNLTVKPYFILLEFIDGVSLRDELKKNGPPRRSLMLHWTEDIIRGLLHLHDSLLLHRDLKSLNIMLQNPKVSKRRSVVIPGSEDDRSSTIPSQVRASSYGPALGDLADAAMAENDAMLAAATPSVPATPHVDRLGTLFLPSGKHYDEGPWSDPPPKRAPSSPLTTTPAGRVQPFSPPPDSSAATAAPVWASAPPSPGWPLKAKPLQKTWESFASASPAPPLALPFTAASFPAAITADTPEEICRTSSSSSAEGTRSNPSLPRQVAKIVDFSETANMMMKARNGANLTAERGTMRWMAPEVMTGGSGNNAGPDNLPYNQASDVYSLGMVMYEMLEGHLPFEGLKLMQVAFQVASGKRPSFVGVKCTALMELLVRMCMAHEPKSRPKLKELHALLLIDRPQREAVMLRYSERGIGLDKAFLPVVTCPISEAYLRRFTVGDYLDLRTAQEPAGYSPPADEFIPPVLPPPVLPVPAPQLPAPSLQSPDMDIWAGAGTVYHACAAPAAPVASASCPSYVAQPHAPLLSSNSTPPSAPLSHLQSRIVSTSAVYSSPSNASDASASPLRLPFVFGGGSEEVGGSSHGSARAALGRALTQAKSTVASRLSFRKNRKRVAEAPEYKHPPVDQHEPATWNWQAFAPGACMSKPHVDGDSWHGQDHARPASSDERVGVDSLTSMFERMRPWKRRKII